MLRKCEFLSSVHFGWGSTRSLLLLYCNGLVWHITEAYNYPLLFAREQAGRAYARRGGGVADCMLFDVAPTNHVPAAASIAPRVPVEASRGKSDLPSHVLEPAFKFGAPTRWASTAKEVMSPLASSSFSSDSPPAAERRSRLGGAGHRSQGSDDSWWSSAGVDPSKTVFGKPSSKKDAGALAEMLGRGQKPVY